YIIQHLLELQQPFLLDGRWRYSIVARHADNGRGRRSAGLDQPLQMARHLRHGRGFEESRDLELDLRHVVDVTENTEGQERVPSRREEVIVNADLLDPKDLR